MSSPVEWPDADAEPSSSAFTQTQATQPVMASQDDYPSGEEEDVQGDKVWGALEHTERSSGSGKFELVEKVCKVGRLGKVRVVLNHPSISNIHAQVYREGRTAFIKAFGRNGSFLNGTRKLIRDKAYELRDHDVISFVRPRPPKTEKSKSLIDQWYEIQFKASRDALLLPPRTQEDLNAAHTYGNGTADNEDPFPQPEARGAQKHVMENPLSEDMAKQYEVREQLGFGAYAHVYRVVHRKTKKEFAVKIVGKKQFRFQSPQHWTDQMNEANLLKNLNHPHIARLYEIFEDDRALFLVMELLRGGELFDRILKGAYPEKNAKKLVRNILQAVDYLHDKDVVHRDLKPENIMLVGEDDDVNIKLVDFGVAKEERGGRATVCGTAEYIAPEVLERGYSVNKLRVYGKAADMWSLGVVVYVLLTATALFPSNTRATTPDSMEKQVKAAMESEDWQGMNLSVLAQDFVLGLLEINESRRLTAKRALNHPWILTIDLDQAPVRSIKIEKEIKSPSLPEKIPPDEANESNLSTEKKSEELKLDSSNLSNEDEAPQSLDISVNLAASQAGADEGMASSLSINLLSSGPSLQPSWSYFGAEEDDDILPTEEAQNTQNPSPKRSTEEPDLSFGQVTPKKPKGL